MKQALHIFKKDVRYLRYEIALTILAAAAFIFTGIRHGISVSNAIPNQSAAASSLMVFLPVTWWFLITRVIQAESPTSRTQFWLTRPYEWKSLLGAKALFIIVFVNLPLLLADTVILLAFGFSPGHEVAGLLWTQVLLIVAFILPATALSSIASGIGPLVTAMLLFSPGRVGFDDLFPLGSRRGSSPWFELEWVREYLCLGRYRRGGPNDHILANTLAGRPPPPARTLAAIAQPCHRMDRDLAVSMDIGIRTANGVVSSESELFFHSYWLGFREKMAGRGVYPNIQNQMVIDLPLQIAGVPAKPFMELRANGLTVTLVAPDGEAWRDQHSPPACVDAEAGIISLRAAAGNEFYAKVRNVPIQLRGTLFFTLFGNRQGTEIPPQKGAVPVPGLGVCSAGPNFLLCSSAFRAAPDLVSERIFQDSPTGPAGKIEHLWDRPMSYSPFPADLSIDPIAQFFSPQFSPVSEIVVETLEPIAYLRRDFEFDNVRLSDFERHPSTTALK